MSHTYFQFSYFYRILPYGMILFHLSIFHRDSQCVCRRRSLVLWHKPGQNTVMSQPRPALKLVSFPYPLRIVFAHKLLFIAVSQTPVDLLQSSLNNGQTALRFNLLWANDQKLAGFHWKIWLFSIPFCKLFCRINSNEQQLRRQYSNSILTIVFKITL